MRDLSLSLAIYDALAAESEARIKPYRDAYRAAVDDAMAGDLEALDRMEILAAWLLAESGVASGPLYVPTVNLLLTILPPLAKWSRANADAGLQISENSS